MKKPPNAAGSRGTKNSPIIFAFNTRIGGRTPKCLSILGALGGCIRTLKGYRILNSASEAGVVPFESFLEIETRDMLMLIEVL